ncbi:ankyrin repeat domain-containing protein 53 isoform X2 [Girardinichthys multiradiatus]|uniref:ankyrin repeat domain-containing protein 53 isoform X2 n=1 Tax=Girardinichthys multiradiatus TaxID=208333 RepID=UPI001FAE2E91|nr:ankyrin repeat domain-containing protein 53 isoform X2 [Girardinichthys multiradiatus]
MERTNTSRRRRRGRRKTRKVSPKAPSGRPVLPDVGAESSEEGLPALHAACLYSELATVQVLLESRPWWINSRDSQGLQPLHMVLSSQRSSNAYTCLRYLLEQGADVNITTDSGQTPLHLAVSEGLLDCTEILVKAGADILAKDSLGLTPLDMAHIWCHRKIARYLKHNLWHAEKEKEMEEIKLTQVLYKDLMNMVKQKNMDKKALINEKTEEGANTKGLPPLKEFSLRAQVSKYHKRCILPEQTSCKPKPTKGQSQGLQENKGISTMQLAASSNSPWTVFAGLQPEKLPTEPDLRESVIVWKDSSSQRLQYITKWDREPHPTPKLPLEVVERVLFPRAFPSRIATSQGFEPQNIEELQHRRFPQGRSTSPWTEVAMHLAEVLELGHY